MKTFKIKVTDRRNKFPPRIYEVQANEELFAYAAATEQFIKDNKIPPRKPLQRVSVYYSRFWNEPVN